MAEHLFQKDARVCFLGDSITANGLFIAKIFDYYRTHYPERRVKMFNVGVPGDSAAGCVKWNRHKIMIERFRPTEVVVMFGMNDVGRHLYDDDLRGTHEALLEAVQRGVRHTVHMMTIVRDLLNAGLPVTLCSSTPFDEISDSPATLLKGCNEAIYNLFLENQFAFRNDNLKQIIDFNTPMVELLTQLKERGHGSFIGDDRVHPRDVGHDVLARLFLAAQGADIAPLTADEIVAGTALMPPLSPENALRHKTEDFLRTLSFLDYVAVWGQENMTLEEKCDYWRTHAEEFGKYGEFHMRIATEYPIKKMQEADKLAELFRQTDAMYPS